MVPQGCRALRGCWAAPATPVPKVEGSDWGNWDQLPLARQDLTRKHRNCIPEIQETLGWFPGGLRLFLEWSEVHKGAVIETAPETQAVWLVFMG